MNTRSADWHPLAEGGCVQHIFPVGYTGLEESEMAELLQFVGGGSDSDSDAVATEPAAQDQPLTRTSSTGSIFRSDSFRSRGVPPEPEPEPAPEPRAADEELQGVAGADEAEEAVEAEEKWAIDPPRSSRMTCAWVAH
jgi:hypothetical protein